MWWIWLLLAWGLGAAFLLYMIVVIGAWADARWEKTP